MFSSLTCMLDVILIPLHGLIASLQPNGPMSFFGYCLKFNTLETLERMYLLKVGIKSL